MCVPDISLRRWVSCGFAFVLLSCLVPTGARGAWQTEWVEHPPVYKDLTNRTLALDNESHPHLGYGRYQMIHSWFDGVVWKHEVVQEVYNGSFPASAVSSGNEVRLAFQDQGPHDMFCGRLTPGGWVVELVDSGDDVGGYASIALDAAGYAHLSYKDAIAGDLIYARETARGWQQEVVDNSGRMGESSAIAVDPQGYPHIAYETWSLDRRQLYAWKDAGGWHLETLASDGETSNGWATIVCDVNSYPHICYVFDPACTLYHQYKDASGWHTEVVEAEPSGLSLCSIALDSEGEPGVSYLATDNLDLKYAHRQASVWTTQTVVVGVSVGNYGSFTSLAVDNQDNAYIAYLDAVNEDLECVHQVGGNWQNEVAEDGGDKGWGNSIALFEGHPGISYADTTSFDLKYAWQDESGWHVETADTLGGGWTSLKRDDNGYPHISYHDYEHGHLRYAWQDESGWHSETVDSGPSAGYHSALVLDSSGEEHIGYAVNEDYSSLHYAHRVGTSWQRELVDGNGSVGQYCSLALDEGGYPHISYYSQSDTELRYCYKSASGWHYEVADNDGNPGQWTSIALVGSTVHVSYHEQNNHELRYALRDTGGWQIETVDTDGQTGYYTSLAVNNIGFPRIAYFNTSGRGICYAWKDLDGWHSETIDYQVWDYSGCTSMALDGAGYAVVSYCSDWDEEAGLKCARDVPPGLTPTITVTPLTPTATTTLSATPTVSATPVITETPTLTLTPLPTVTETVSPTVTATALLTVTVTSSPTGSVTLTATPSATLSLTATPTTTPSPSSTPTLSPTATPTEVQLILEMPAHSFGEGDTCSLSLFLGNEGAARPADLYVLLEVFGEYWSYPAWQPLSVGLSFEPLVVPAGNSLKELIAPFTMPAVSPTGPLYFYAALFEPGTLFVETLISNVAWYQFSLGE